MILSKFQRSVHYWGLECCIRHGEWVNDKQTEYCNPRSACALRVNKHCTCTIIYVLVLHFVCLFVCLFWEVAPLALISAIYLTNHFARVLINKNECVICDIFILSITGVNWTSLFVWISRTLGMKTSLSRLVGMVRYYTHVLTVECYIVMKSLNIVVPSPSNVHIYVHTHVHTQYHVFTCTCTMPGFSYRILCLGGGGDILWCCYPEHVAGQKACV